MALDGRLSQSLIQSGSLEQKRGDLKQDLHRIKRSSSMRVSEEGTTKAYNKNQLRPRCNRNGRPSFATRPSRMNGLNGKGTLCNCLLSVLLRMNKAFGTTCSVTWRVDTHRSHLLLGVTHRHGQLAKWEKVVLQELLQQILVFRLRLGFCLGFFFHLWDACRSKGGQTI